MVLQLNTTKHMQNVRSSSEVNRFTYYNIFTTNHSTKNFPFYVWERKTSQLCK